MQTRAGGSTLRLSGKLGVQQARPLWDAFQAAAALRRAVLVQARDIEEIDTSIAQILCRAVNQGAQLQIAGASDGFLVSLQRRGLEKFFIQSRSAPTASGQTTALQVESGRGRSVKRGSPGMSRKSSKGRARRG
jgi:ABC-type transporter Mla MlaB component